jgi:hypothetical protein
VALAETFLKEALSSPPIGGGLWSFQRSVNFNDRTGSLQILLTTPAGTSKTRASLQAGRLERRKISASKAGRNYQAMRIEPFLY